MKAARLASVRGLALACLYLYTDDRCYVGKLLLNASSFLSLFPFFSFFFFGSGSTLLAYPPAPSAETNPLNKIKKYNIRTLVKTHGHVALQVGWNDDASSSAFGGS